MSGAATKLSFSTGILLKNTTLITDFDNTLYDWFHMWHQSFSGMLAEIVRISGLGEEALLPDIRRIHQEFGTSEYAFLVEKLAPLQEKFQGQELAAVFDDAIHAYRKARKENLSLYPGVRETLSRLKRKGVLIVIYTDSRAFYTADRIRRLQLDDLVDYIFSPPDHAIPTGAVNKTTNILTHAQHHFVPEGVVKPNPEVLLDILKDIGRHASETVYLGDSLMRDVAMAQDAGVTDVYAEYGVVQNHPGYPLLRKASHWTDADVEREKQISKRSVKPTHIITAFTKIEQFFED